MWGTVMYSVHVISELYQYMCSDCHEHGTAKTSLQFHAVRCFSPVPLHLLDNKWFVANISRGDHTPSLPEPNTPSNLRPYYKLVPDNSQQLG